MKIIIRYFFKTLRLILGPVLLLAEWFTTPKGVQRPAEQQQVIDEQTRSLALYQFRTCPFCIKVRKVIARLSLDIERRDALHDPEHRAALQAGGGAVKVPCLRIEEGGEVRWLYESDAIIAYLEQRFPG